MCLASRKKRIFKTVNTLLICTLVFSLVFPQQVCAARSSAGGGKIAKFDGGRLGLSIGIGLGAMAIGGAINASMGSALHGKMAAAPYVFEKSLTHAFTLSGIMTNYNTFVAVSQVGRAAGMMGSYYGWSPSSTFLLSGVASAATGGFLNPEPFLGEAMYKTTFEAIPLEGGKVCYQAIAIEKLSPIAVNTMLKGAFVGSMTGLASGGVMVMIDGGKINKGDSPGIGAQIGGMVAGVGAGNFSRALLNPTTYIVRAESTIAKQANPQIGELSTAAEAEMKSASNSMKQGAQRLSQAWNKILAGDFTSAWSTFKGAVVDDGSSVVGGRLRAQQLYSQLANTEPHIYSEVSGTNPVTGKVELGNTIPSESMPELLNGKVVSEYYSAYDGRQYMELSRYAPGGLGFKGVGANLFEATFLGTANIWPELAVRALSIAATNSLSKKKQWMAPLVSAVVEGVASPFVIGFADMYALRPGLYYGQHHIMDSIKYIDYMGRELPYQQIVGKDAPRLHKIYTKWQDVNKVGSDEWKALSAEERTMQTELLRHDLEKELNNLGINKRIQMLNQEGFLKLVKQELTKPALGRSDGQIKVTLSQLEESFKDYQPNLHDYRLVWAQAQSAVNTYARDNIMHASSIDDAFSRAGTSRGALFFNRAFNEAKFGLVEGLVGGGIASLASKWSEKDPVAGMAAGYGASMLTALYRGKVWYNEWEPSRNEYDDLVWTDKWGIYQPEPYKDTPGQPVDVWNKVVSTISATQQKQMLKEFGRDSGIALTRYKKPIHEKTISPAGIISWNKVEKDVYGREIRFIADTPEDRPTLRQAVLFSLAQANYNFLGRAFSFGAPLTEDPKNINTLIMYDYTRALQGYGMSAGRSGWLLSGITSGGINAAASTISNNLLTSMAAIKPMAEALNIQHQRLVRTDAFNSKVPFTVQSSSYEPWKLGFTTRFWAPFPYTYSYRALSSTGQSYSRESQRSK